MGVAPGWSCSSQPVPGAGPVRGLGGVPRVGCPWGAAQRSREEMSGEFARSRTCPIQTELLGGFPSRDFLFPAVWRSTSFGSLSACRLPARFDGPRSGKRRGREQPPPIYPPRTRPYPPLLSLFQFLPPLFAQKLFPLLALHSSRDGDQTARGNKQIVISIGLKGLGSWAVYRG